MKRFIAGGTGFIGQALAKRWLSEGHEVNIIGRDKKKIAAVFGDKVIGLTWNDLKAQQESIFAGAQCIVNLTGARLDNQRWSPGFKQQIRQSRIESTQLLAELIAKLSTNAPALLNANGVAVYGPESTSSEGLSMEVDEDNQFPGQQKRTFLTELAHDWEQATESAQIAGVRVVIMRFGVVLSKDGGALPKMALPFRLFIGGRVGSGQQPMSWISLIDLINAIEFVLNDSNLSGPVNFVAPGWVTQDQFAAILAGALHRPHYLTTPAFVLETAFGKEMAQELLLTGQKVAPKRLLSAGFKFTYPDLKAALAAIYRAR